MSGLRIRKLLALTEEVQREQGKPVSRRTIRGIAAAVVSNPYAGRYEAELGDLPGAGDDLARLLCEQLLGALQLAPENIEAYGKGAIVGCAGELEHAAAIIHPKFGKAVRSVLGDAKSLMPSVAKRAGAGARIDVPVHHTRDEWSADHFDSISFCIEDAPTAEEIVIILAFAASGRPLARTLSPGPAITSQAGSHAERTPV
ncbi:amino acid synthesis family protein [Bradyrhizobium sp. ISRA443]|uniref:amino acid synthesis family protein n=1 Tax=unclassified Bradyrhizobium TaxID=2631580 RepID=UPI002479E31E|nr:MULTISPECIES: amino acid synthesis family protein [unclassified Bradyrhizobium]WGR92997.1 amino acid synthesis family protein [Bradyrhizobium sp. ISRA435]WGR97488.1 amino acid synthesis family protein [Bradyrhizobium sp. ISRA436]WGS04378.1 amino acid synthesis family protein [Bradyrhizobium sp. ISRA437]WGS11260.1 amino acid synthesis family protein [Bradyrhizobium sp. ISRA443]